MKKMSKIPEIRAMFRLINCSILFGLLLVLTGCVHIQPGDADLDNPFGKDYVIQVDHARGVKGHVHMQAMQDELEDDSSQNGKKIVNLSYSVKNKLSEMDSLYGAVMLPFEILTVGIIDLLGIPSDFVAQTVYMDAVVQNEKGLELGRYSATGRAWQTVAVYYGYDKEDALKMADARAFNKALNELYEKIEENDADDEEKSEGLTLTTRDLDKVVKRLVDEIIRRGELDKKKDKYVLAIGNITAKTKHDLDDDLFVRKLRIALRKAGKVQVSTMDEEKEINGKLRELRKSEEVDQRTVIKANTAVSPNVTLSGKIEEKVVSSSESEYIFKLTISDSSGEIALWEVAESYHKFDE